MNHPLHPLGLRYAQVRAHTLALAAPLSEADCQVQSMPDASPTKWHLAHVTWFFETFVLERFDPDFRPFHPAFRVLFNSYYQAVGEQHPRPQRGLITRPDLNEVKAYRAHVDQRMQGLLQAPVSDELRQRVELGLQHEQQHQELLLTDIKHLLACNPLNPVYDAQAERASTHSQPLAWVRFEAGLTQMGHEGSGFAFDNESPRHPVWLPAYEMANRPVTQGDWLDFMADGGYADPRWWMSAGWDWVRAERIAAPAYWQPAPPDQTHPTHHWTTFTLHGREAVSPHAPMTHLSWFEADAYARWLGAQRGEDLRLPTEAEWEHAARTLKLGGDVWEWTGSAYLPHPGYQPWSGDVGEYNGKFMVNQMVLKGGSWATPPGHIRSSYRNFFPTAARWQFSGLRLARSEHTDQAHGKSSKP